MSGHRESFLVLKGAVAAELLGEPFGKRRFAPADDFARAAFRFLDTFDGRVLGAGHLLIEVDGELLLFDGIGPPVRQSSPRHVGFVRDLGPGPMRDRLDGIFSPLRCLLPLGDGQFEAGTHALVDGEGKTQARLALWTLTGRDGAALGLAMPQGLRGYDRALAQLDERLRQGAAETPLALEDVPSVLFPDLAFYRGKPDIAMSPDEIAFRAATDIVGVHLALARRNEPGVIADHDTEFLHDYRVALRKVRSVLSLFKGVYDADQTQALKARFSALMAPTGRLRDLDVYLLERDLYFELLPEALHGGLAVMFDLFAEARAREQARLARRLRSAAYAREIAALQEMFETGAGLLPGPEAEAHALDYARRLIWKRYRKVCRLGMRIDDATPDPEVHELRIQCKKLRYLMEFFAPLFGRKKLAALIKALKALQDRLGAFNDYAVQQAALEAFLRDLGSGDARGAVEIAKSVGALIAILHRRQDEARTRIAASFAGFDGRETRAGFRALFHEGKAAA
jgi:CHAD domain-containing protein